MQVLEKCVCADNSQVRLVDCYTMLILQFTVAEKEVAAYLVYCCFIFPLVIHFFFYILGLVPEILELMYDTAMVGDATVMGNKLLDVDVDLTNYGYWVDPIGWLFLH